MKRMLSIAVVMLLALGIFAVPVQGSTDRPVWSKGEKWAMGMESTPPSQEQIGELEETMKNLFNLSNISIDVSGSGGAWATFEVTDVSNTEYTLHYSLAVKNKAREDYYVSAMMPEPGTYTSESFMSAQKSVRQMEAHISMNLYVLGSGDIIVEKDSMGVRSVTLSLEEKFEMDFNGKNLPSVDEYGVFGYSMLSMGMPDYSYDNYSEGSPTYSPIMSSHTLSYEDTEIKAEQTLNLDLSIDYSPPAVFIDFPLSDGSEWNVSSDVNITGTYSGTIDVSGLPPMVESMMTMGTGQSFPIKIEKMNTYSPDFNNGEINMNEETNMGLKCNGTMQINDENGNPITVYKIQQVPNCDFCAPPQIYLLYSPDKGFIAGIYAEASENNIMPAAPGMQNSGMYASFGAIASSMSDLKKDSTLSYMDYSDASSKISATEQEMKGSAPQDFFGSTLFFILIGAAIAAAVVVSIIALRKRKRPPQTEGFPPKEAPAYPQENPMDEEPPVF